MRDLRDASAALEGCRILEVSSFGNLARGKKAVGAFLAGEVMLLELSLESSERVGGSASIVEAEEDEQMETSHEMEETGGVSVSSASFRGSNVKF